MKIKFSLASDITSDGIICLSSRTIPLVIEQSVLAGVGFAPYFSSSLRVLPLAMPLAPAKKSGEPSWPFPDSSISLGISVHKKQIFFYTVSRFLILGFDVSIILVKNMFRFLFFLFVFPLFSHEIHQFAGKHFLASYLECDGEALTDLKEMIEAMNRAVLASGATILDQTSYVFPPSGLTIVYLLSESHASLHTYPEHNACFVDIFTCGDQCTPEKFDAALRDYLKPQKVNSRLFLRHEGIEELNLN